MSSSNVRNIESLEAFHDGLVRLSADWETALQEVRIIVNRADEYFAQDRPRYWRQQGQLAERRLSEAKENLAQKRTSARIEDRPSATEAVQRVRACERRVRVCEAKVREAKSWSIAISQIGDQVLGPLADVAQHCEVGLPGAAIELRTLVEQLKAYARGES